MNVSTAAKMLGSRGGLARARRLSRPRRVEIAMAGATARAESLRLAHAIRSNFDYLEAIRQLRPARPVRSASACRGPLPGLYAAQGED